MDGKDGIDQKAGSQGWFGYISDGWSKLTGRSGSREVSPADVPTQLPDSPSNKPSDQDSPDSLSQRKVSNFISEDFEIVDDHASGDIISEPFMNCLIAVSGLKQETWQAMTEEEQDVAKAGLRELREIFFDLTAPDLADSLVKTCVHSDTSKKITHIQAMQVWISSARNNLATLLDHSDPLLTSLDSVDLQLQKLLMNQLQGSHTMSEATWDTVNKVAVKDPTSIDEEGFAGQFHRDLFRKSHFYVFNDRNEPVFHSRLSNQEIQQDYQQSDSDSDAEPNGLFKEECCKQLIKLCKNREELLGIVSDLVSQSPYNPLWHSINLFCAEQLKAAYACSPVNRKLETRLTPLANRKISVELTLACKHYDIARPDGTFCRMHQPILITTSMVLDPIQPEERRLGPIVLKMLEATDCVPLEGL